MTSPVATGSRLPRTTGKTGWPWTTESQHPPCPETRIESWPRITVVTPSLNQGDFIEETIRSVLLQEYANLEYVIMDGGSADRTPLLIQQYAPWISHWQSGPDAGQTAAINAGWRRATGELLAWLNSDDTYLPGTLEKVGRFFAEHPKVMWLCGSTEFVDGSRTIVTEPRLEPVPRWLARCYNTTRYYSFPQPSVFIRRSLFESVGPLDESLHYCMDFDFWCRIRLRGIEPHLCNDVLARALLHPGCKTVAENPGFFRDDQRIVEKHFSQLTTAQRAVVRLALCRAGARQELWRYYQLPLAKQSLAQILRLVARKPLLVIDRAFWGGLRRRLRSP